MKPIIRLSQLPPKARMELMRILDRNRVKKSTKVASWQPTKKTTSLSKYHLRSQSFGVSDYLNYITNKLKR
jgi:hypothetical protein